jgi:alpha-tubulin suppressor-like RCC1 family protein
VLSCWGRNTEGELGRGTQSQSEVSPQPIFSLGTTWASYGLGSGSTCTLGANHSLWCWGGNWYGQIGDGTTQGRVNAVQVH